MITPKTERPTICLVTALPPSSTTLTEYGQHLANAFQAESTAINFFALADRTDLPETGAAGLMPVHRCWSFNSLVTPFRLLAAVRKHRPDLVIFNAHMASFGDREIPAAMGLLSVPLLRLFGFKTGVILHNVLGGVDLEHTSMRDQPVRQALTRIFGRAVLRLLLTSNYLTVTLQDYRDLLAKAGPVGHVTAIAHGSFETSREIDFPALRNRPRRICTFGKFGTYKKLDNLIRAFRMLREMPQFANVELVIGGGNHQSAPGYIEKTIAELGDGEGIRYIGYVDEDEVPAFFHHCQVTVFDYTSTTGSSGALNQAVSYGSVPVFPAIEDFNRVCTDEGIEGINFEAGDVAGLFKVLRKVLAAPEDYQSLVERNFLSNRAFTIRDVAHFHIEKFASLGHTLPPSRCGETANPKNGAFKQ